MAGTHTFSFTAEVKEVSSKKTASLDVQYRVSLLTDNPAVLALGTLNGDTFVNVEITPEASE